MIRVMIASGIEPSAIAGRIEVPERVDEQRRAARRAACRSSMKFGHDLEARARGSIRPCAGSHWSWTAKMYCERQAEDEDRDADPEQRDDRHAAVDPALGVAGGEPAERDAEPDREQHRRERQLDGRREADQELRRGTAGC